MTCNFKLFNEKDNLKQKILSPTEEKKLLAESAEHLRRIIITALNTGMRRNEIFNLKWENIDLKLKLIEVTKTKAGKNRTIPINDDLYSLLSSMKSNAKSEYIFPNPETGEPFQRVRRAFVAACRRAGIEGLRFHDLRHTFATRCIRAGVDIHTLKELLGHHSITVTERYLFSGEEQKRKAVNMLNHIASIP